MRRQVNSRHLSFPAISLVVTFFLGQLALLGVGDSSAVVANAGGDAAAPATDKTGNLYVSDEKCERCHREPLKGDNDPRDDDGGKPRTYFFKMTEYPTWSEKDKHSLAYGVLDSTKNEASRQIGRLMGIKPQTDGRCLSCHSLNCGDSQCQKVLSRELKKLGVACQACHGPASKWVEDHDEPDAWRKKLTREEKKERGMTELRDPVTRADKCLSCHLGNPREGKVVTHEMYAAGHPPVSGFEVENYLQAMPAHWVPEDRQPPELQKQYGYQADETMRQTRHMAIGGLVAIREYARLIGYYAHVRLPADNIAARGGKSSAGGTELGVYDCQACHHELTLPSWRQARGYRNHPGRPASRTWPLILGKVGLAASGEQRVSVFQALQSLDEALDWQPFGDPARVEAASTRVEEATQKAIENLDRKQWDGNTGIELAREICNIGATELLDYESSRQLGWAFEVIRKEHPKLQHDAEVEKLANVLRSGLALQIPQQREAVMNHSVPQTLAASSSYRPDKFSQTWAGLRKLLRPAK